MQILVVCESSKKAHMRVRRTLSKYLYQTGRRTWLGNLSFEGIKDAIAEIKKTASRNTAVCFWKHNPKRGFQLLAQVGSKKRLGEDGLYSFANKDLPPEVGKVTSAFESVLALSALFHDVGKGTVGFQNKLRSALEPGAKNESDAIRHELVSTIFLAHLLNENNESNSQFAALGDPLALKSRCIEVAEVVFKGLKSKLSASPYSLKGLAGFGISEHLKLKDFWPSWLGIYEHGRQPNLRDSLLWLVLTHHKFPENKPKPGGKDLDSHNYGLNPLVRGSADFDGKPKKLTFLEFVEGAQPWLDADWIKTVSFHFKNLNEKIAGDPRVIEKIVNNTSNVLRPLLVLGDYNASADKKMTDGNKANKVFANTLSINLGNTAADDQIPDENTQKHFADTLPIHLLKANEFAQKVLCEVVLKNSLDKSNVLKWAEKYSQTVSKDSRFVWQSEIVNKLAESRKKDPTLPCFCVVVSGTGTGKTRALAAMASAISFQDSGIRFTLGLGLRSLALQTSKEYTDQKIFKKDEVVTLVGNRVSREIWEAENTKGELSEVDLADAEGGTSNSVYLLPSEFDQTEYLGGSEFGLNDPDTLKFMTFFPASKGATQDKISKLIRSPVCVATIDHFVHACEMLSGKSSFAALRLMTSDLVLDEIDSYSATDLVAVGRLVYFAGLCGRNVILASASAPQILISSLFKSWSGGLASCLVRSFESTKSILAFATHFHMGCKTKVVSHSDAIAFFAECYAKHAELLAYEVVRRRPFYVNTAKENTEVQNFNEIFANCLELHEKNSYPVTYTEGHKINFSIGVVKWNRSASCREFARWLMVTDPSGHPNILKADTGSNRLGVICYHSKFNFVDRYRVENFLDRSTKRNIGDWDRENGDKDGSLKNQFFPFSDVFTEFLAKSGCEKVTNVMIVVSATSILETGRDHDYDWAISDPVSVKSLVQLAGRIRRHRPEGLPSNVYNLGIMQSPSQEWPNDNPKNVTSGWSYPGIETSKAKLKFLEKAKSAEKELFNQVSKVAGVKVDTENIVLPGKLDAEFAFGPQLRASNKIDSGLVLKDCFTYSENRLLSLEYAEFNTFLNSASQNGLLQYVDFPGCRFSRTYFTATRFRQEAVSHSPAKLESEKSKLMSHRSKFLLPENWFYSKPKADSQSWEYWRLNSSRAKMEEPRIFNNFINLNLYKRSVLKIELKSENEYLLALIFGKDWAQTDEKNQRNLLDEISRIEVPKYWWDNPKYDFEYHPLLGLGRKS
jgi:CRISPR-associated endonuclease/helicase Cas3